MDKGPGGSREMLRVREQTSPRARERWALASRWQHKRYFTAVEQCARRSTHACHVSRGKSRRGNGKGKTMFAVIKSGGRQYKVAVGEKLEVNRLPVEVGEQVRFAEVLLISDAENT